jgi:hypothetical protein
LNTKVPPKIMLINSKLFKVIAKQVLPLLANKCNNYGSNRCFSPFNSNELILHVMMNMYVMLMLVLWDVNACLTPRGVTPCQDPCGIATDGICLFGLRLTGD